jgi:amino-acid N-acetyltransferase
METPAATQFVAWFRQSSPYIHAFRGRTFVISFDGAAVIDPSFPALIHDLALLHSLGIRLVLVHGARPQIEQRLQDRGLKMEYVNGRRVTDADSLTCVKDAVGSIRLEIEALLSMGLANSPMAGARLRVASGNFVTAKPLGVRGGIDYCHSGEVRRVDADAIKQRLDDGTLVLLSPLGFSPTGEIFNLTANEVAAACAISLQADKLLFLTETNVIPDTNQANARELTLEQAQQRVNALKLLDEETQYLQHAIDACRQGVRRTHLIDRHIDGALLLELFTRDGVGTLIGAETFEGTRQATIEDVGGILELIKPLEEEGMLVRRSREQLELEVDHFTVVDRDGTIIACGALYPYAQEGVAELACLAVQPGYRQSGRGDALLTAIEKKAKQQGLKQVFVLTTHTAHWFQERGYEPGQVDQLPVKKQTLYNYQRKSKVFVKAL